MNYIVMDLEWNQSTNDEKANKDIPFEIIEIGAVKLNEQMQLTGEFKRLIRPQIYTEIHYITENLIRLSKDELVRGDTFVKAATDFLKWCGEEPVFCTWGPLDLVELQRNMKYYHMKPIDEKPAVFYDVQKLFSIAYEDKKLRRTLEFAVDYLEIEKDIPFHRAYSDAYYTARVLQRINKQYLSNYSYHIFALPNNKKEEIRVVFDTYSKYITRGFQDKTAALSDREIMSNRCFLCGKTGKRRLKWFTTNGKHYYSVGFCPEHGYTKAKVRVKKTDEGAVYIVKTSRLITPEEYLVLKERQKKAALFKRNDQL